MKRYYLSNSDVVATVSVNIGNTITGVDVHEGEASDVKEFVGQSLDELMDWMKEQGQVEMMEI